VQLKLVQAGLAKNRGFLAYDKVLARPLKPYPYRQKKKKKSLSSNVLYPNNGSPSHGKSQQHNILYDIHLSHHDGLSHSDEEKRISRI
jgi:hypothetical protein